MITKAQVLRWIELSRQAMDEQRDYLTELDTAIGDGDHGLNMQRGFTKAAEKVAAVADKDIGTILKTLGMTLLSQVGGASGPLYGTFFMKATLPANGKQAISLEELIAMLKAGMEGVIARGRAEAGDKTLCDVWLPVLQFLENADLPTAQRLQSAVEIAEESVAATIPLIAKKGRASYLGERSQGHQDPGATSSYYLIKALSEAVNG